MAVAAFTLETECFSACPIRSGVEEKSFAVRTEEQTSWAAFPIAVRFASKIARLRRRFAFLNDVIAISVPETQAKTVL